MIKGIDISHQNDFNLSHLSPEVAFIWHKATQGAGYKDPMFNSRWQWLKTTDKMRGAYHFLTVNSSAEDQANNFLSLSIDFSKPNVMPPMLDVEDQVDPGGDPIKTKALNQMILDDKPGFIKKINDWIDIVQEKTKRKVVIYSYKNFFKEYLSNHSWPDNYLWLASYQFEHPGIPVGYNHYDFWQYSDHGTTQLVIDPVHGSIDLDYYNGTLDELKAL